MRIFEERTVLGRSGGDVVPDVATEELSVVVDGPAVRWQQIVTLRERIAAGTYQVSSGTLAEKLIAGMLDKF